MNIIIYEDEGYKNFLPLTWTRPVYDLRCGVNTLAEKIKRQYPKAKVEYSYRYYLPGHKTMKFEKGLFINGRILAHERLAREIPLKGPDEIFIAGQEIVAIRAVSKSFAQVSKKAKIKKIDVKVVRYPWDLVFENTMELRRDKKYFGKKKRAKIHPSAVIYNPADVLIEEGVEIEANAVIDARNGLVHLGEGVIVRPHSYLKGPLSIGAGCRVAGEVSRSIFHANINKQHYGFIGDAYVGEWVNLGAGTTNSNLKNNYGNVKVVINGKSVNTKQKFIGCFIGDHAKTGIGTLITTGAVIGFGANVFGGGVTAKNVPNFAWGAKDRCKLDKFLETAKTVLARRKIKLTTADEDLLKRTYRLAK